MYLAFSYAFQFQRKLNYKQTLQKAYNEKPRVGKK